MNTLQNPSREYSVMPFWFWNDELSEAEILRQIADFDAHGVYGFVIHPRVGLPRSIGWMSERLLGFMKIAVEEARRREMKVILYDEGMYPSGSSCGQVVQSDPSLACRCFAYVAIQAGESYTLKSGETLVAECETVSHGRIAIIDRPADTYIRGLHYIDEGPKEDEPPAGDILNPRTTQKIIELVHEPFYKHFREYFGSTVLGVFTDEPNPLGKCREKIARPGTTGLLPRVSEILKYDFTPHLPALWFDDEPDALVHRKNYLRGVRRWMDKSWYAPLSKWCEDHGVALCGHPADGDEIGTEKFFHIPGQDIVWRFIEPDKASALEGAESTQGKVTSSAMIHLGRTRNSNEFCGAYGNQTTYEEFEYLANWLLIRGANLLIPHAFYYSVRGPRKEERPPDVGPNSAWWSKFKPFADHCRRLSWLNAESQHVCRVAILADPDHAPWKAARVCFENQIDFNYLDWHTLLEKAKVSDTGIALAGMQYDVVIIDGNDTPADVTQAIQPMERDGRVVVFDGNADALVKQVDQLTARDVRCQTASPGLRVRHVRKENADFYLFFNETSCPVRTTVELAAKGAISRIDTRTASENAASAELVLAGFESALRRVTPKR